MKNPVSEGVRMYRLEHQLTQKQLAELAAIPRASIANIESREGNPSIAAVVKVARALGVTLEDLLKVPAKKSVTKVTKDEMQVVRLEEGNYVGRLLTPLNAPYILINDVMLLPGCHSTGRPHPAGSHEFFYCLEGAAKMFIDQEEMVIDCGDLIFFPGNLPHIYCNTGMKPVHAISVVVMDPTSCV